MSASTFQYTGTNGGNSFRTYAYNPALRGLGGHDRLTILSGGGGLILGGDGNDTLEGGSGVEEINRPLA